jgi:hypothetical protein
MTELIIKSVISEILFDNRICESLENYNIVNYLYNNLLCEKLLIGEPITISELRKILRNKIVNFEFIKLDGDVRPAKGTTMMSKIPDVDHPKGIRPSSPKVATFYDLSKKAWRSVSQKSKEIVLKKDEVTGKPVVVIKPKGKEEVKPKVEEPEIKLPEIPEVEPKAPEVSPEVEKPEISKEEKPEDVKLSISPQDELEKVEKVIQKATAQVKNAQEKVKDLKQQIAQPEEPRVEEPKLPPPPKPKIKEQPKSTILIPIEVKDDSKKPPIELPDNIF